MTDDQNLDELFKLARAQAVPDDLALRVTAEAQALQPRPAGLAAKTQPARGKTFWAEFLATVGGWQGVGAMTAMGLVGFWVGVVQPMDLVTSAAAAETLDVLALDAPGFLTAQEEN